MSSNTRHKPWIEVAIFWETKTLSVPSMYNVVRVVQAAAMEGVVDGMCLSVASVLYCSYQEKMGQGLE